VSGGEHEDRHAATGGDDALGDLVSGGARDVAVEDGDVVGVDAQQLQSSVTVTGNVGRDRFQPQPSRIASAMKGSSSTTNTRMLPKLGAGAYRQPIENHIPADNITLP
jgi:hypothetical protein